MKQSIITLPSGQQFHFSFSDDFKPMSKDMEFISMFFELYATVAKRKEKSEPKNETMLASEEVLRKEWDGPEEDEAWKKL